MKGIRISLMLLGKKCKHMNANEKRKLVCLSVDNLLCRIPLTADYSRNEVLGKMNYHRKVQFQGH